jgi:sterol desaturase/sphingolipid hydroxylase (fatty acid hydroxylase superfamily)
MHHTHYHVNFGQFFIFCDWYWDTLRDPHTANTTSSNDSKSSKAKLSQAELMQGIDKPVVMKKTL